MKKVYLVVNQAVQDGSDFGIGTLAYDSLKKAQEVFKEIVEDEKNAIKDLGLEWKVESDTDYEFFAFEEGYYNINHIIVELRDLLIK